MLRKIVGVTLSLLCVSCAVTSGSTNVQPQDKSVEQGNDLAVVDLKWLDYADPTADANLAIAKQDFQLLAFSQKNLTIPGVNLQEYTFQSLQQQCGVRVVKGSDETQLDAEDGKRHKKLQSYTRVYNKQILAACLAPREY